MIDAETLLRSSHRKDRYYPGGADAGRFIESMTINGRRAGMKPAELARLRQTFLDTYLDGVAPKQRADQMSAVRFFQAEMALVDLTRRINAPAGRRKPGLSKGSAHIADDFDAPLPDEILREFES